MMAFISLDYRLRDYADYYDGCGNVVGCGTSVCTPLIVRVWFVTSLGVPMVRYGTMPDF